MARATSDDPPTAPPMTSPCPFTYLVSEWMTTSAPSVAGRNRIGVAKVASRRGRDLRDPDETRAAAVRERRERGDVVHAEERICDRLRVEQRGRLGAQRALDRGVIRCVHEDDVDPPLAGPALEEGARLPVAVLLRDDPATRRDGARVDERGDRG